LSTPHFELRLVETSDEPFLFELYESTRGQMFALAALEPGQREMLVRMQFEAQRRGYRQQHPNSREFIVMAGGERVGRLWLEESEEAARVVDITVAPARQGNGLGTAVMEDVIERARRAGRPVRLSVDKMNGRAYELYRRLGFEACGDTGLNIEMKREA
jgi:ribosomal protein S18 acetylase RimI-like enzyme